MECETRITEYGKIRIDFNRNLLSDLCIDKIGIQTGPFGSQLHNKDYVEIGTPIITVEHLGDNRILHQNTPYVSDADKKRLSKYLLQTDDIVFSRVGSVDRRALVRETEDGWLFSGRCLRVRVDKTKIDPVYLSYFFGTEAFKQYIRSIAVGATMPSINTKILSDVPIYCPELEEQLEISNLFKSLDNKIELNHQTNQTLEQISQTIFKSWFVDFEPVKAKDHIRKLGGNADQIEKAAQAVIAGAVNLKEILSGSNLTDIKEKTKAKLDAKLDAKLGFQTKKQQDDLEETAKLFPDSFVESELGFIPDGWKYSSVKGILKRLKPTKRYKKKQVRAYGKIPVFEQGAGLLLGFHNDTPGFESTIENPIIIFGDHTCIMHLSIRPFDISQNVIPIQGKTRSTVWVYYAIKDGSITWFSQKSTKIGINFINLYDNCR